MSKERGKDQLMRKKLGWDLEMWGGVRHHVQGERTGVALGGKGGAPKTRPGRGDR